MTTPPVASDSARHYLRLHLVEGIGPILTKRLVEHFGGIAAVLAAPPHRLEAVEGIGRERAERIARADPQAAEQEIDRAAAQGVRIIGYADADYPAALRNIADPPPCLYVRGRIEPEDAVALGIVGARHCTVYGAEQAERFAALAAQAGMTVVSGMALGIDTAAHRGALQAQGRTIAVLGCGMCHLYPPRSGELAEQIAASGALLSDFPMETPPVEHNFPRRNRIIAGLSLGVLVVEASQRSGALITARLATEYNREVFAVPGRVDTAHAEGCHHLIRTGAAKLVTNLADILDELGDVGRLLITRAPRGPETPGAAPAAAAPPVTLSEYERQLLDAMTTEPASIETLTFVSNLSPARVAATLTALQLKGLVRRHPGDLYAKAAYA
jgi:DNA processing protein